jgi:hypothetical protein
MGGVDRDWWAASCRSGACVVACTIKFKSVSFRPAAGPSYFSLPRQREVTKRKATPLTRRHCCAMPVPCATRHLRAGVNSAIHGLGHARLSPEAGCVARRCRRDPRAERLREIQRVDPRLFVFDAKHRNLVGCAARKADQRGPCLAAGGRRERPAGASTGRCERSPSAGCAVGEPSEPDRGPAGQDARRAPDRGALLFGHFLLGKQEKVTRAVRRTERNALDLASNKKPSATAATRSQTFAGKPAPKPDPASARIAQSPCSVAAGLATPSRATAQ